MSEYLKEEIIEYIQDYGVADFIKKVMDFCIERGILYN